MTNTGIEMVNNKHISVILKAALCVSVIFTFHFSLFTSAFAQKYACVNTDYVLRSIPDYSSAQKRLDKYVADWQKELSDKAAELDAMRADFEQDNYLLPENLKKRRQEEIKAKEQEISALQHQRFGAGGDLDKKRAELLKPVQDRVYNTIERVAQEKNYAFVFDKAASATLLFANKKYDISDEVLELLGYKPNAASEQQQKDDKGSEKAKKPTNPEMRKPGMDKDRREVMPPMGAMKK